jgi:capsular polysaccharide biosynthesis protein
VHEIFVTYSGICISNDGIMRESHHSYHHEKFVKEAAYYFNQAIENRTSLIELDDDNTYALIHHPWAANYWHWMTESILRLWMIKDVCKSMVLILPSHLTKIDFIISSLKVFEFKEIYQIPPNKSLMIRNLCLPQIKPVSDSYDSLALTQIREIYLHNIEKRSNVNFGTRIYISRKKSERRKVVNEEQVEIVLREYGFVAVNNEDYNFNEQVNIYSGATHLVSIHGAGLTNMLFMKEGSSILELHKEITNSTDWHSFAFWYLADALGFKYYHQLCKPADSASGFFEADFIVDLALLRSNLQLM